MLKRLKQLTIAVMREMNTIFIGEHVWKNVLVLIIAGEEDKIHIDCFDFWKRWQV